MNKQEFSKLYQNMKLKDLAKMLGCSIATIHNIKKKFGLSKKNGRPRKINIE